jgi:hypothetical protein
MIGQGPRDSWDRPHARAKRAFTAACVVIDALALLAVAETVLFTRRQLQPGRRALAQGLPAAPVSRHLPADQRSYLLIARGPGSGNRPGLPGFLNHRLPSKLGGSQSQSETDQARPEQHAPPAAEDVCGRRPDPAHPRLVSQRRFEELAFDALDSTTLAAVGVGRLSHAAPAGLPFWPLFTFRET